MKLEEAIKQSKPFRSELQKLFINIQYTSSWLASDFSQQLKPYGITPQQYNVLRILKGRHPGSYSNQEILARMIDKSSNSTRIVDKLIEKRLAHRAIGAKDRRAVEVTITELGLALLTQIESNSFIDEGKLSGFDPEKARLMNEWLDELRDE